MTAKPSGIATPEEWQNYLEKHPDIDVLEVLFVDMNGMLRGKRLSSDKVSGLFREGITAPGTMPLLNSLGDICESLGLGTLDGDPDRRLRPIAGSLAPVPWMASNTHQVLTTWFDLDDQPGEWDPRVILDNTAQHFRDLGLRIVVAIELEFYLLEQTDGILPVPLTATVPGLGRKQGGIQFGAQEDLLEFEPLFERIRACCSTQALPASSSQTEWAPGQFEINLNHVEDPLLACDHAVLLKRLIKGVARQLGHGATFMAKPFSEHSGNGMHMHISLYDSEGNNVFAQNDDGISENLRHAIGGLSTSMLESQAVFAPNANSYRRFQPGNFVPMNSDWGFNHRGLALRIPVSDSKNTRIEHRVAGADANPYLVLAAVLAGMHHGITNQIEPSEPVAEGEFIFEPEITLASDWGQALQNFEQGKILQNYFGEEYAKLFAEIRADEYKQFMATVSNLDYEWYLRGV